MNKSENYSKVVCNGDSGSGLMIPQMVDGEERYYLEGVVSTTPKTSDCRTIFFALYTNVNHYKDFIYETSYVMKDTKSRK